MLCCVMDFDQYAKEVPQVKWHFSVYTGRGVSGCVCSEEWKKFDCSCSGVQTQED
jgi:hypothetical protein